MISYAEFMDKYEQVREFGPDFELREVKVYRVHCAHCGQTRLGEFPRTDKALAAAHRLLDERPGCRNPQCVSNGGTEKRAGVSA